MPTLHARRGSLLPWDSAGLSGAARFIRAESAHKQSIIGPATAIASNVEPLCGLCTVVGARTVPRGNATQRIRRGGRGWQRERAQHAGHLSRSTAHRPVCACSWPRQKSIGPSRRSSTGGISSRPSPPHHLHLRRTTQAARVRCDAARPFSWPSQRPRRSGQWHSACRRSTTVKRRTRAAARRPSCFHPAWAARTRVMRPANAHLLGTPTVPRSLAGRTKSVTMTVGCALLCLPPSGTTRTPLLRPRRTTAEASRPTAEGESRRTTTEAPLRTTEEPRPTTTEAPRRTRATDWTGC